MRGPGSGGQNYLTEPFWVEWEGNLIIPNSWVTSKWDSRWEDRVKSRMDPDSCHPSFSRGPTILRQTNPENGTDRPISPDSVELEIALVILIRYKGKVKAGPNKDFGWGKHLQNTGEGDVMDPDLFRKTIWNNLVTLLS